MRYKYIYSSGLEFMTLIIAFQSSGEPPLFMNNVSNNGTTFDIYFNYKFCWKT